MWDSLVSLPQVLDAIESDIERQLLALGDFAYWQSEVPIWTTVERAPSPPYRNIMARSDPKRLREIAWMRRALLKHLAPCSPIVSLTEHARRHDAIQRCQRRRHEPRPLPLWHLGRLLRRRKDGPRRLPQGRCREARHGGVACDRGGEPSGDVNIHRARDLIGRERSHVEREVGARRVAVVDRRPRAGAP